MDDVWTTDSQVLQEEDGHNNLNNVLLPEYIKTSSVPDAEGVDSAETAAGGGAPVAILSSAAPDSTTADLAGQVPKEGEPAKETAPEEQEGQVSALGAVPETPANGPQDFSVKPIPASAGIGNPISVPAGEPLPDQTTFNRNTVESTVTTSKEDYDKGGAAFSVPDQKENLIPESSLPMGGTVPDTTTNAGPTIQSVAPESSTVAMAADVPLEEKREGWAVDDADEKPSATLTEPAPGVPEPVKESIAEAHEPAEAAASPEAVEEKKAVEQELLAEVKTTEATGEPAPTVAAVATEAKVDEPKVEEPKGEEKAEEPKVEKVEEAKAEEPKAEGPKAEEPAAAAATDEAPAEPSAPEDVTQNAPAAEAAPTPTEPTTTSAASSPATATKDETKKKRKSFFGLLKDRLKG